MTNAQIQVTATVRQIKDANLWGDYCSLTGMNPYAEAEGLITPDETVSVPIQLVTPLLNWSMRQKPKESWPKRTKFFLHGNADSNWDAGKKLGLSEEAIRTKFRYALYEVEFDVEVDEDGTCRIVAVDGKALAA